MPKRGGLGRGLDALIPDKKGKKEEKIKELPVEETIPDHTEESDSTVRDEEGTDGTSGENPSSNAALPDGNEVVSLPLSKVEPNRDQPRKYFDDAAIEELADSIRQFGIIQPLLVQKTDDYYQIIAGERRWRAAARAGLKEVPVIIRTFSNQEAVEVALIENIQREDLNPIEEAKAYRRLVTEYHLSQEEVASRVSKSRSAVTNSMRLLKLEDNIQTMVETGALSEGHARAILPLPSGEMQKAVAEQIVKDGLSVRQTEKAVRELLNTGKSSKSRKQPDEQDEILAGLSEQIRYALDTKVQIRQSGKSRGKIEIEYSSDEELNRICELLRSLKE